MQGHTDPLQWETDIQQFVDLFEEPTTRELERITTETRVALNDLGDAWNQLSDLTHHVSHVADLVETQLRMIARLCQIGDALVEQILTLLGPLSTHADTATVEFHNEIRNGAVADWADVRGRNV